MDMRCFVYRQDASVVTIKISTSLISECRCMPSLMMIVMMMIVMMIMRTPIMSDMSTGREQVIVNLRRELPVLSSFDAIAAETKLVRLIATTYYPLPTTHKPKEGIMTTLAG